LDFWVIVKGEKGRRKGKNFAMVFFFFFFFFAV